MHMPAHFRGYPVTKMYARGATSSLSLMCDPALRAFSLVSVPIGSGCSARPTDYQVTAPRSMRASFKFTRTSTPDTTPLVFHLETQTQIERTMNNASNPTGSSAKMTGQNHRLELCLGSNSAHCTCRIGGLLVYVLLQLALADRDQDDEQVEAAQQVVTHLKTANAEESSKKIEGYATDSEAANSSPNPKLH